MATWNRRKTEPETAWKAFVSYREQRSPRRMQYVTVDGMAVPLSDILAYSKRYDWTKRVFDYDSHLDSILLAGKESALKKGVETATAEHLQILASFREVLGREAAKLNEASRGAGVPVISKQSDLIKLADTVVKLERLVLGQSTEAVATNYDLSKLSTEELKVWLDLTRKAQMVTEGE